MADRSTQVKADILDDPLPVSLSETTYSTSVDEVSSSLIYLGKAVPGSATSASVWQIQKIEITGAVTRIKFADGNANFDNVWDDRATLTYS